MEKHYIEVYNPLLNQTKVPTKRIVPREVALQQMLRKIAPYVVVFGIVPATESAPALVSLRYIMRYGARETTLLRRMIKANNRRSHGLKWSETVHRKDSSWWRTQCNGVQISLGPWSSIQDFDLLRQTTRCDLAGIEMIALPTSVLGEMIKQYAYIEKNFPGIQALEFDPIPLFWTKPDQTRSHLDKSIDPILTPLSLLNSDATQQS